MLGESELWPAQKAAQDLISQSFADNKIPFFRVGMYAGKTTFANYIVSRCFPFKVFVVGPAVQQVLDNYSEVFKDRDMKIEARTPNMLLKELIRSNITQNLSNDRNTYFYRKYNDSVFIFDEADWYPQAKTEIERLIITLRHFRCQIMVITSRSDNPLNLDKAICNTYNYASWDWNPNLTVDYVAPRFIENKVIAARDYGLYDSHNTDFKEQIIKIAA